MSDTTPFDDLRDAMPPESRERANRITERLRRDIDGPAPAPEVVMDSNGAYWRRYPDHLSMPPVSDDNEPLAGPVAVYRLVGWESTRYQPISESD